MSINNRWIVISLSLLILGVFVGLQLKSVLNFNKQKSASQYKVEELQKQLDNEKRSGSIIKLTIDEIEKKSEANLKAAVENRNNQYLQYKLKELKDLRLKAGLEDVKGPGITIRLDDALARVTENPNVSIIHDSTIVKVLNQLKIASAQAISVSGERIISTSEQVCAGPTIRINMNRLAVPFIIKAIGNPDLMYNTLDSSYDIAYMKRCGIRVDIQKEKEVVVPKYNLSHSSNLDKLISMTEGH